MTPVDGLSPPAASHGGSRLHALRARVAEMRDRARRLFDGGATGVQVAASISESTDALLRDIYNETLAGIPEVQHSRLQTHAALVAVGGTGRGDLAPHSDIDLLFLFRNPAQRAFHEVSGQLVRDCWDAGLKVGHSLRTVGETIALARSDIQVATGLVEARLIAGSAALVDRLRRLAARRVFRARFGWFLKACLDAREDERRQHGFTIQQLEPDVKRSLGGLRDLHLLRWIAFARYGAADFDSLRLQGILSRDESHALLAAHESLLRIRADLHFAAGKGDDVLTRDEQLRIAEERGIEPAPGLRPVERFMQEHFRHTEQVRSLVQRFVVRHQPRSVWRSFVRYLAMHRADRMFCVGAGEIDVLPRFRRQVCGRLDTILQVHQLAALYGVVPAPRLLEEIREAVPTLSREVSEESGARFLEILGRASSLGSAVRSLHDTRALEVLIPQMKHARCLLQFNQYHSYTVDEHTLRAIEAAEGFANDPGPVGDACRQIRQKGILHLALLLHDIGKGYEEDHSEVGRRIALDVAARLRLSDQQRETLAFLVHKHLRMAHLAFRRDLDDPQVIIPFSHEVGSAETLRMLYVLTAADLSAVGPGVWNRWKADLLTALFDKTMHVLTGEPPAASETRDRVRAIADRLRLDEAAPDGSSGDEAWSFPEFAREQLAALPPNYVEGSNPERVIGDLRRMQRLRRDDVLVEGWFDPETLAAEYSVIAHPSVADGCFHKIAGVLTAKRMDILAARISTTTAGVVLDSFRVLDRDYAGAVPSERIDDVGDAIRSALTGQVDVQTLFLRGRRFGAQRPSPPIDGLPMRVVVDGESSDRCTIIDVFAHDRPGLLYAITRGLYELGLSVVLAKISTHFDQVVDVFYVTDATGERIRDEGRLRQIRDDLELRIAAFARDGWRQYVV